jgi:hypothetical protein
VDAVTQVPLLQEVGPTRFALAIQLAAAVLLALVLDRVLTRSHLKGLRRPSAAAGLAVVVLVPLLPNGFIHSTRVEIPRYFAHHGVTEIPKGSNVLTFPYPYYTANDPMLWQLASHMRFRIMGGEVYVPSWPTRSSTNYPEGGLPADLWSELVQGQPFFPGHHGNPRWTAPSEAERVSLVTDLQRYVGSRQVGAVVVQAGGRQGHWVDALMTSAFGPASTVRGEVSVWLAPTAP